MKIEEGYTALEKYTMYANYSDDHIYEIGEDRTVPDITQTTMKGDTNSQYITFQMPRYYDGVDLTTKQIIVRWYNEGNVEKGGSYSDICDARYNEDYIRFAWLLDFGVTEYKGQVAFAFENIGTNEIDKSYVWKTALGKLEITDNVDNGAGGDEPSEDWFTNLMARIDEMYKAAEAAENMARVAEEKAADANTAAEKANTAAGKADTATGAANTAANRANTSAGKADTATDAANTAADAANTAAQSVFTDKNFFLLRNEDGTLKLVYNEEQA